MTSTLYELAMESMKEYIEVYLDLGRETDGFATIRPHNVQDIPRRRIILSGIGSPLDPNEADAEQAVQEWRRMQAVPFDAELAVKAGVYVRLRSRVNDLLKQLEVASEGFTKFDAAYIRANPYMLPILQRLANISSKFELKNLIGNASDNSISQQAAEKLALILTQRSPGLALNREQVLQSTEPTLEGIVRDLVGRVLLENIVANALEDAGVPYKREAEYRSIKGVVYNFRADFVIPNDNDPKAFVEVRKSSSRHASLYAKDKMFSAINWKGRNKDLLAVLVVSGPWTAETLRVMARVFDYVVPLEAAPEMAEAISSYLQGDRSRLKWLIHFDIEAPANPNG